MMPTIKARKTLSYDKNEFLKGLGAIWRSYVPGCYKTGENEALVLKILWSRLLKSLEMS